MVMLVLEGRLSGEWVEELRKACERLLAGSDPIRLVIALTDMSGIDEPGRDLLTELYAGGAGLVGIGIATKALIEDIKHAAARGGEAADAPNHENLR